jgi:hypothetical protein
MLQSFLDTLPEGSLLPTCADVYIKPLNCK